MLRVDRLVARPEEGIGEQVEDVVGTCAADDPVGIEPEGMAERLAREDWRCAKMRMTVISLRDELIAWYERRGYRRTGEYKPFPYGDARFGIPKRDDLCFEWLEKAL